MEPPNFVELEVTDAPPGVKGNTASGTYARQRQQHTRPCTHLCLKVQHAGAAHSNSLYQTLQANIVLPQACIVRIVVFCLC